MQAKSAAGFANGGASQLAGSKRPADESNLNDDQRFTKRFHLLNLRDAATDSNSKLYIPVSSAATYTTGIPAPDAHPAWREQPATAPPDELMQLDETSNRVFIHDLDQELAEIEAANDEEKLIFLPDIERRLSRIPKHVLTGRAPSEDGEHQELVLYSTPKSLSVDEGHDAVRKAVIEARQRAREKAAMDELARREDMERKYDHEKHELGTETAHGYSSGYGESFEDPDAMEIG